MEQKLPPVPLLKASNGAEIRPTLQRGRQVTTFKSKAEKRGGSKRSEGNSKVRTESIPITTSAPCLGSQGSPDQKENVFRKPRVNAGQDFAKGTKKATTSVHCYERVKDGHALRVGVMKPPCKGLEISTESLAGLIAIEESLCEDVRPDVGVEGMEREKALMIEVSMDGEQNTQGPTAMIDSPVLRDSGSSNNSLSSSSSGRSSSSCSSSSSSSCRRDYEDNGDSNGRNRSHSSTSPSSNAKAKNDGGGLAAGIFGMEVQEELSPDETIGQGYHLKRLSCLGYGSSSTVFRWVKTSYVISSTS
jgi:hypothetical protein